MESLNRMARGSFDTVILWGAGFALAYGLLGGALLGQAMQLTHGLSLPSMESISIEVLSVAPPANS